MNIETGKTYLITAERKGTFMMRVTEQCDTWITGVVCGGKTNAMLDYNVKESGDEVTCRASFIRSAVEQPQAT